MDLRILEGMAFLCEPGGLRLAVARLASFRECRSAREVAQSRRERLDYAAAAPTRAIRTQTGKVGLIPIHGPLDQHYTDALDKLGGTSCDEVSAALSALLADPAVSAVVCHFDSPGGATTGIGELAEKMFAARSQKPLYGIADSMACSAAQWLFSACSTRVCTPGGMVGAVGCYAMHEDTTAADEQAGIKVSLVSSGKYKTEFVRGPLTDEARGFLQETVDGIADRFVAALAKSYGIGKQQVRDTFGQGRMVACDKAMAAGMVDRCMSFEELLGKLTGGTAPMTGPRATAPDVLRLRHEWQKTRSRALDA